jgi:hypothetical protein
MSNQRFAVEFDRRVVGIAVRVPGGFMFFASVDEFEQLDGKLFRRARAIARGLEKVASARRARRPVASRRLSPAIS